MSDVSRKKFVKCISCGEKKIVRALYSFKCNECGSVNSIREATVVKTYNINDSKLDIKYGL